MKKLFIALLLPLLLPVILGAQTSKDAAVALSAGVVLSPTPSVTISWPMTTPTAGILLFRREKGSDTWYLLVNDSLSTLSSYVDVNVETGKVYEYGMQKEVAGIPGFGYLSVALQAPLTESRGTVLVFVEQALTTPLASELNRLRYDLIGDGWNVRWHAVTPNGSVATIKNQIIADYNADPTNTKAVLLLGNLPVPYSGNTAWDAHTDHTGAWPSDTYYGDVNGTWTDNSVNNTTPSRAENDNVPGDGKFDQSIVPSTTELAVGRVDFSNLSSATFGATATELMRRYLNKDHRWRVKEYTVGNKTLVDDNFGYFGGEAFGANGYRNGYALVGAANVVDGDFFNDTDTQSFLFGYGCGGGTYTSADGVGNSGNFATDSINVVFSMLFGSYHGDWDYSPDPFMPAALASKGGILTCTWAGRPHWFFQHMGTGETVGYSAVETQNTCDNVGYPSYYGACGSHTTLLGDPTLRAHIIAPATNLALSTSCGNVTLHWTASTDAGVSGYQVYRSSSPFGAYTKLTANLVAGTSYVDINPPADTLYYQVRAVALQSTSTNGSYWNSSTGTFGNVIYLGSAAPNITAVGGLITCYFSGDTLRGYSTTPGASFHWSGPGGFSSDLQNAFASTAGMYTLTVTGLNGCTSSATAEMLEDTDAPVVTATASPINCNGPAQLEASVIGGQVTWTGPNGFTSNLTNPTAGETGVYTVTGLNIFNGCTATASVMVAEIFDLATDVNTQVGGIITCSNTSVNISATSSTQGASFSWTGPGGFIAPNQQTVTVNVPGAYTVVVTHPVSGCTDEATAVVSMNAAPPLVNVTGGVLSCTSPQLVLGVQPIIPGATYSWEGPGGFQSNLPTPTVTAQGVYELVVTGVNGCTSTATATVTVDASVPTASAIGGLLTCYTPVDTVRGNSNTPNVSFSWYGPNGFTSNLQNPPVTEPGNYTLVVTAPNGCTNSASVFVLADFTPPLVSAIATGEINCVNTSLQIFGTVVGGEPFWSGPNGYASTELNPTVPYPGPYTLTGLNLLNGCTSTAEVTVTDNTTPPQLEALGGVIYCANGGVTLSAVTGPGVLVAWPGLPGGATPYVTQPGAYQAVALDLNNGCSSADTAYVTVAGDFLSASIDPVMLNCNGVSNFSVTANGGLSPYSYLWSNGATTPQTSYPNANGTFAVTVTDDSGCTVTLGGTTTEIEVMTVSTSATDVSEAGGNDGTATATPNAGVPPFTYLWSNGQTTQTITGLTAGVYSVTVTSQANGCTAVGSVTVETMVGTGNVLPEGWSLRLSPNPAGAYAWLELSFPQAQESAIRVEDLSGRTLLTLNEGAVASQRIRLDLNNLPSGMYIVRVQSAGRNAALKLAKTE